MKQKNFFITASLILIIIASLIQNNALIASDTFNRVPAPEPDITNPGPDTASFPTSPFTLPKGRGYFENFPFYIDVLSYTCHNNNIEHTYTWPFLLRIAVTDFLEFRITGQGLTHNYADNCQKSLTGFSPLSFGIKTHLWGDQDDWRWAPSAGIEVYIVTPIASKNLKASTQFIINALFDHRLTDSLVLEWNLGLYSRGMKPFKKRGSYLLINGSIQQEITKHIGLFVEGLYSTANYPLYPANLILGFGFLSTLTKRICIYGSYNWAVHPNRNPDLANFGFAVAF